MTIWTPYGYLSPGMNQLAHPFNRNNVGLDHWAFKVGSLEDLKAIEQHLRDLNVPMEDNGITDDDFGGTAIFTQDPDGMKVEFHLVKSEE